MSMYRFRKRSSYNIHYTVKTANHHYNRMIISKNNYVSHNKRVPMFEFNLFKVHS